MAKAAPSFQFYPSDFVMGTGHLDAESAGCYVWLLCYQWTNKGIPDDRDVLAGYCRMTPQKFARVWEKIQDKFESEDGMLFNRRLEDIREVSRKRAESGKRGGKVRASDML